MEKAQKIIEIVEIKSFEGRSPWEVVFDLETTQKEILDTSGSWGKCPLAPQKFTRVHWGFLFSEQWSSPSTECWSSLSPWRSFASTRAEDCPRMLSLTAGMMWTRLNTPARSVWNFWIILPYRRVWSLPSQCIIVFSGEEAHNAPHEPAWSRERHHWQLRPHLPAGRVQDQEDRGPRPVQDSVRNCSCCWLFWLTRQVSSYSAPGHVWHWHL